MNAKQAALAREARWAGHGDNWPEGHRPCTMCNKMQPYSEYHKHKNCLYGINTVCKTCRMVVSKKKWAETKWVVDRVAPLGDLYMMECQGYYKIGYAIDVEQRRKDLQTGNPFPITIVKIWPGRADLELEVHDMLCHVRHQGEWFRQGCEL